MITIQYGKIKSNYGHISECLPKWTKIGKLWHDFFGAYYEQKNNHLETCIMLGLKSGIFLSLYFF